MTQSDELSPSEVLPPPPAATLEYLSAPATEQVWRDGMMLVIAPNSALPARCLKCNGDPGAFTTSTKISTMSAWYPLFSSAGWNAHIVDDRPIYIPFSLCPRHRLKSLARIGFIGLIIILTNVFTLLWKTNALGWATDLMAILVPVVLMVVMGLSMRPIIRPRRVHHGLAWFVGAGAEFLESLPELDARKTSEVSSQPVEEAEDIPVVSSEYPRQESNLQPRD
jgi:hypothetical protein